MAGRDLVGQIRILGSCDSTNAEARRLLAAGSGGAPGPAGAPWLLVTAEEQSGGRGRLDRSWTSPRGAGLLMSLALAIPASAAATTVGWLPLIAGLAAAAACRRLEVQAAVKWPNDVVVGDPPRKLAGVLVERTGSWAVIGIGLNVDLRPAEFPTASTGSLVVETGGAQVDRAALLAEVVAGLVSRSQRLLAAGDAERSGLHDEYLRRCVTVGQEVRVQRAGLPELTGRAVGIDSAGHLLMVDGAGVRRTITVGDVVHLRPRPA